MGLFKKEKSIETLFELEKDILLGAKIEFCIKMPKSLADLKEKCGFNRAEVSSLVTEKESTFVYVVLKLIIEILLMTDATFIEVLTLKTNNKIKFQDVKENALHIMEECITLIKENHYELE